MPVATRTTTELAPISAVLDAIDEHRAVYHAERLDGAGHNPMPWPHPISANRAAKIARILHIAANVPNGYLDRLVAMADVVSEAYGLGGPDFESDRVALLGIVVRGLGFDADEYFMTPDELDAIGA